MEDQRAALEAVAAALRPLHKALVDVTTVAWEREHGRVPGPAALFHLLIQEPFFAWLRPMSGLMAELDELLDEEGPVGAAGMRARVEALITENGHHFAARYLEILQQEPDVVMAHAALRRALAQLPGS
jgi:hypothetical protein